MTKSKAYAITARWNVDHSISLYCGGRLVNKFTGYDARPCVDCFLDGWFGDNEWKVRWVYAQSKKKCAA